MLSWPALLLAPLLALTQLSVAYSLVGVACETQSGAKLHAVAAIFVVLVAITVFFLILNSTLDGVRNVNRDLVRTLTLMGATRFEVVAKVLVPATLPWIFTGMRISGKMSVGVRSAASGPTMRSSRAMTTKV